MWCRRSWAPRLTWPGTASVTAPTVTVKGKVYSIPEYLGGAHGDVQVFVLAFDVQDEPVWAP